MVDEPKKKSKAKKKAAPKKKRATKKKEPVIKAVTVEEPVVEKGIVFEPKSGKTTEEPVNVKGYVTDLEKILGKVYYFQVIRVAEDGTDFIGDVPLTVEGDRTVGFSPLSNLQDPSSCYH